MKRLFTSFLYHSNSITQKLHIVLAGSTADNANRNKSLMVKVKYDFVYIGVLHCMVLITITVYSAYKHTHRAIANYTSAVSQPGTVLKFHQMSQIHKNGPFHSRHLDMS